MYTFINITLQGEKNKVENFINRLNNDKVRTFIKSDSETDGIYTAEVIIRIERNN